MAYGTSAATSTAVHAAVMEAQKASGPTVHLEPREFGELLSTIEQPLIVHHHRAAGMIMPQCNQYVVGHRGLVFYTKSRERIDLPRDAQVIRAKAISMVS